MHPTQQAPRYDLSLLPQKLHSAAHTARALRALPELSPEPSLAQRAEDWRQKTSWKAASVEAQQQRLAALEKATRHERTARGQWTNPAHQPRVIIRSQRAQRWPWSRTATATAKAIHIRTTVPVDAE